MTRAGRAIRANTRLRDALAIWRMRNASTGGDRAYAAYLVIMVGVIVAAPAVRALWLAATGLEGLALLGVAARPVNLALIVGVLWVAAFFAGRLRGPALRALYPLYVLAGSDLKRSTVLIGPVLRSGLWITVATTTVSTFAALALAHGGGASVTVSAAVSAAAAGGALVGIIATGVWLLGQAVLSGLNLSALMAQAARWETAATFASGLDFSAATSVYQSRPRRGRRRRAVVPGRSLALTFLRRDAVGAMRTPGRLIGGVLAVAGAGVLMVLAAVPAGPGFADQTPVLGIVAGLVLYGGIGPLTDGIRHAARAAADLPLYGVSDRALVMLHAIFPLLVVTVTLTLAVAITGTALAIGAGSGAALGSILSSLALGALALLVRVSGALKGMLPPSLLTPMPTPMGDMSIVLQLTWALDGVIVIALAGAAAVLLLQTPGWLIAVVLVVAITFLSRWRGRNAHRD